MDVAFKVKKNNYASVVEDVLGKKWGVVLHVIFILTTYGGMIIYTIVFASFLPYMLIQFGMNEEMVTS